MNGQHLNLWKEIYLQTHLQYINENFNMDAFWLKGCEDKWRTLIFVSYEHNSREIGISLGVGKRG